MPKVTYTAAKGLVQESGSGFANGFYVKPGSTTKAAATLPVPLTHAVCAMTTDGAEALTLANGTPGQVIHIHLASDGGDGTLTPTTASGWATIVFADAGDRATLQFVDGSIGWIILGLSGVAGPPETTV